MKLINLDNPEFELVSSGKPCITLESHEALQINLGINQVLIKKTQLGWVIDCNHNITIKQNNANKPTGSTD